MQQQQLEILEALKKQVNQVMPPDPTAHDWPHVFRVYKLAQTISEREGGDAFLIGLIALTHDLYDHKFFTGTEEEAKMVLTKDLQNFGVEKSVCDIVVTQVFSLSYSKADRWQNLNLEGKIVQDADRIEAIGAIGIARAFAFGGYKGRVMNHNDEVKNNTPEENRKLESRNQKAVNTFDHFYEKLLKLFDLLNTNTAKDIAKDRFEFMQEFVKRFEQEWDVD